jgi:transaldolase
VSIEVDPGLARDTDATVEMAKRLWARVDRPNLLIKIPATGEGLPAITAAIAAGISVNVTLIFSLERYAGVIDAYLSGLEQAAAAGLDLSTIHSVASFFVSRVDSEIDKRLTADDPLRGKAAIANARLAYELFEREFASERFTSLSGGNRQRPLWASTGVKDPAYPDTMYVTELVVDGTVNTMPEKTLKAFADHGEFRGDTVHGTYDDARAVIAGLEMQGISYDEVVTLLEVEGVDKFDASWAELLATVQSALNG